MPNHPKTTRKTTRRKFQKCRPWASRLEQLEDRRLLAADLELLDHGQCLHGVGCGCLACSPTAPAEVAQLAHGHFLGDGHGHANLFGNDMVPLDDWRGEFYTPDPRRNHDDTPLTVILDFNDPGQANTTDGIGNVVSTFDVSAYGFSAGDFNTVANAVLDRVETHYDLTTNNFDPRSPILEGYSLDIEFEIGNIGTPPSNGSDDFYYIQIGSDTLNTGNLGQAAISSIRNSSGVPGAAAGSVVGSSFTDTIQGLSSLTPSNALSSGNLAFTVDAIAGTVSHEIGHALSLLHIDFNTVTSPTSFAPIMGTGATGMPNQERIFEREFSFSGTNSQANGQTQRHIDQLIGALGTHDTFDFNDRIENASPRTIPSAVTGFAIDITTDVDLFEISVTEGQRVGFDIDSPANSLDPAIRIFDSNGNPLAANDDGSGPNPEIRFQDSYLQYVFGSAGTYYLGVSDARNQGYDIITGNGDAAGGTGDYELTLTDLGTDNNGTLASALPVVVGATFPPGSISPAVDVDLVRFDVEAGERVELVAEELGFVDLRLRLFNSVGAELAQSSVGNPTIDFTFVSAGTYFAGVTGIGTNGDYDPVSGAARNTSFSDVTNYQFHLNNLDADDQTSTANPATVPGDTGVFALDSTNDVDMFAYTISAGQTVGFDVDNSVGVQTDAEIRLFDAAGNELAMSDDDIGPAPENHFRESYLEFTFDVAGTYYLGVTHFTNDTYDPLTGDGDNGAPASTSIGTYSVVTTDLTPTYDIVVSEGLDDGDGNVFNGLALREAIELANRTPGSHSIAFDPSVIGTIALFSQLPTITDDLSIIGPGADLLTLSAAMTGFRHFEVNNGDSNSSIDVVISGLTMSGSDVSVVGVGEGRMGAAINNRENLTIIGSSLESNSAFAGGAIANRPGGVLNIIGSTLSGNSAVFGGGALHLSSSSTYLSNSTISGNAAGNRGSAIYQYGAAELTDTLKIQHSTFQGNEATAYNNAIHSVGSGTKAITLENSIIAGGIANGNVVGDFNLLGSNDPGITGTNNQFNIDALLGPLADNGGPTLTHALLTDSPAINAGDPNATPHKEVVLGNGPSVFWEFEESSSLVIHDTTGTVNGTNNGGRLNRAGAGAGTGQSIEFDGIDDYLQGSFDHIRAKWRFVLLLTLVSSRRGNFSTDAIEREYQQRG